MRATKDSKCYVCGPDNPRGLQVPFQPDGPDGSVAHYRARPEHGGWNGILHGGVTFALMEGEFEVAKMAVAPGHQGNGIGRRLLCAAIAEARRMQARRALSGNKPYFEARDPAV